MKHLKLILILLMASGFALAKKSTAAASNQTKFDIRKPISKYFNKYKEGIRAGIATGSLDSNTRARLNNNGRRFDGSNNETISTNFQLHIGYEEIKTKQIGFSSYLIYQDIRGDEENVRNMRVSGNATYGLTAQAYTYGGLNYSKYYGSAEIEDTWNAGIGYQIGLGLKLHKRANLEIEYLTLLNEGGDKGVNFDQSTKGVMIKLNTPLFL